ncbi:MAG: hypothetical protein H6659_07275 [Ardenticatenaceae bacterium]|nr:hypothetical protein [Ardenticatenaceae bacterium]
MHAHTHSTPVAALARPVSQPFNLWYKGSMDKLRRESDPFVTHLAFPSGFWALLVVGLVVLLGMAGVFVMAYREAGGVSWLVLAVGVGLGAVGLGYLLWHVPRQVRISAAYLEVRYWGRDVRIALTAVTAVSRRRLFIFLSTAEASVRLTRLHLDHAALLWQALQQTVPLLQARQHAWRTAPLPFAIRPRRTMPWLLGTLGFVLLGAAFAIVAAFIHDQPALPRRDGLGVFAFSLICAVLGITGLKLALWDYVYLYQFAAEAMVWRSVLRVRRWNPRHLQQVALRQGEIRVRNIPYTRHWLELIFADGRVVSFAPHDLGVALDISTVENQQQLADVAARLRHVYLAAQPDR